MALEKDMEERKDRRMKDTAKAKKLKEKGNEFMKEGKYQEAMEQYTLALEYVRPIISLDQRHEIDLHESSPCIHKIG